MDATTGEFIIKITASDGEHGDSFGYAVALSGSTAIVGAYANDDNGLASGSAYVFTIRSTPLDGDYNADGFVSQADLDLVLLNWGESVLPDGWFAVDQFDGEPVSQNELDAVLLNWGLGLPPAPVASDVNVAAIPEPATAGFLFLAFLGLRPIRGAHR